MHTVLSGGTPKRRNNAVRAPRDERGEQCTDDERDQPR